MGIQKEREAFEKWANENIAKGRMMNWQEWCWEAWQAAKAQAVPEGFVVVPKKPTMKMIHAGEDVRHSKFIVVGNIYKAMIEAQEPK